MIQTLRTIQIKLEKQMIHLKHDKFDKLRLASSGFNRNNNLNLHNLKSMKQINYYRHLDVAGYFAIQRPSKRNKQW